MQSLVGGMKFMAYAKPHPLFERYEYNKVNHPSSSNLIKRPSAKKNQYRVETSARQRDAVFPLNHWVGIDIENVSRGPTSWNK